MFNLGFLGSIKTSTWDSVPAMQHQEIHGHNMGDEGPELGTWPMGPIIQNIPWAQQMDMHINIQLKEHSWLALTKQNTDFGCPKPAASILLEPSEQKNHGEGETKSS